MTRARCDRGAVLPLVALLVPMLVVVTAIAVDLGRQRSDRRLAQAGADVVALDLIRIVEGRTLDQILSDPDTAVALSDSAARNGFTNAVGFVVNTLDPHISNVEWGVIPGDDEDGTAFVELNPLDPDDLVVVPTAVRVTAERTTDYFFQPGQKGVTRVAIATEDKTAGFQVGTRLASVSSANSVILNAVLGGALGGTANISALDYSGLIGSQLSLGDLAAQLGFGSPDELADATVNARDFYLAGATLMQNQGNTAAASAFTGLATTVSSTTTLNMANVVDIQQGGSDAAASAGVDAFSLITGSAYAINGTSTISVPGLTVALPGVGSTTMTLDITEQPRIVFGREGVSASTRQASLTLTPTINTLTVGGLVRITGTLPLTVQLAGGTGTLSDIDCGRPGITVGLAPRPVSTTQTLNLSIRTLLGIQVATATGVGVNVTTQGTSNGASFLHPTEFLPDVGSGTMVPANSTSLGITGAANVTAGNITVLGVLPVPVPTVVNALNSLLAPMLPAIDAFVVDELNDLLGLNIGGADLGALDMTCRSVKLVG